MEKFLAFIALQNAIESGSHAAKLRLLQYFILYALVWLVCSHYDN